MKSFSRWAHKHCPFPLGDPMEEIRVNKTGSLLDIERALTKKEYQTLLDYADRLIIDGGRSTDRRRHKNKAVRPRRETYRPYRNRAIIYTLLETGMRRAAVTHITLDDIDRQAKKITALEKGGNQHSYKITAQGLKAIEDYIEQERPFDAEFYTSPALFLSARHPKNITGKIQPRQVNRVWDEVCKNDLQDKGVRCWFAPEDIKGGKKIRRQLDEASRIYDKLILILSGYSMNSEWVAHEIKQARKREVDTGVQMLFPISIVDFREIEKWELFAGNDVTNLADEVRSYFIPDFSEWKDESKYQKSFDRLLKDLRAETKEPS